MAHEDDPKLDAQTTVVLMPAIRVKRGEAKQRREREREDGRQAENTRTREMSNNTIDRIVRQTVSEDKNTRNGMEGGKWASIACLRRDQARD